MSAITHNGEIGRDVEIVAHHISPAGRDVTEVRVTNGDGERVTWHLQDVHLPPTVDMAVIEVSAFNLPAVLSAIAGMRDVMGVNRIDTDQPERIAPPV